MTDPTSLARYLAGYTDTHLLHRSLAHYLAAVGVIGLLEVGSVWRQGACVLGGPLVEISDAIEARRKRKGGLLPLAPTKHPFWCNQARRSLVRGVEDAREWLAKLTPEQRRAELDQLLAGHEAAASAPKKQGGQNWNLGTLMPSVINSPGNETPTVASAWLPVLAWEAQRLIVSRELRATALPDVSFETPGDVCYVIPEWEVPLTCAEVFLLLNGGPPRWHLLGLEAPISRRYYNLRDTTGGGRTMEFCPAP
jgi:hypothetical protein